PAAPTVTSNVVYGSNLKYNNSTQSLLMDIYQPTGIAGGDTCTKRALVIVCHGGSFIGGSKTGTDVVPLCTDFAKLGYVAASIEYRVGMTNFPFGSHTVDSTDAGAAVMRAVHDGRAAIRYFKKNAAVGGNTYKIDTNNIFFAGVSAGGFVALHIAYMDQLSEFPSYIDTTGVTSGSVTGQPGMHGGLEGNSGNPGYNSKVKAIINICGALGDTAWMKPGDTPVLSFHGTADGTVPYGSALIYLSPPSSFPLLQVDGSSSVAAQANNLGIPNCMVTWLGQDHVPEVSSAAYFDSTITISRNFLEHYTCGVPMNCNYTSTPLTGINNIATDADFAIYPNPTYNSAIIDLSAFKENPVNITLYDALGRQVKNIMNIKTDKYVLTRDDLISGIYFMNVTVEGRKYSKKIIFE
ncbi:MAG: T9SS type A sorting domain-containing protein, partial [Bacteroidia bacterium]